MDQNETAHFELEELGGEKLSDKAKISHSDAVPGNDKSHAHSHAAHLGVEGNVHTSPEGKGKQGREPGALREPPQDPARSGKTFRRQ